jgi:hypothetical protein
MDIENDTTWSGFVGSCIGFVISLLAVIATSKGGDVELFKFFPFVMMCQGIIAGTLVGSSFRK